VTINIWEAAMTPSNHAAVARLRDHRFRQSAGRRDVLQEVRGNMGGDQSFEGLGIGGFDNVTREQFGTWIDSMSAGLMVVRGKCAADAKKCTLKGRTPDPIAGKEVPVSETMTMTDDDHFTFELRGPGPDGKMFKMLEIVYTRTASR
jgi:hypothetical protein